MLCSSNGNNDEINFQIFPSADDHPTGTSYADVISSLTECGRVSTRLSEHPRDSQHDHIFTRISVISNILLTMGLLQTSSVELQQGEGIVSATNHLSSTAFTSTYVPTDCCSIAVGDTLYTIEFNYAGDLSQADFTACFRLVELTSSTAYKSSSRGWKPKAKRREMKEKDMRYLLVKQKDSLENVYVEDASTESSIPSDVEGFLSFMITEEDDYEVLYIYEIHLGSHLRRHGVGKRLMQCAERVAGTIGLEKVMLTVFTSNAAAERFYRTIGYVDDEYSPAPKRLRNGIIKRPDYIIMSKQVKDTV